MLSDLHYRLIADDPMRPVLAGASREELRAVLRESPSSEVGAAVRGRLAEMERGQLPLFGHDSYPATDAGRKAVES